MTTKKAHARTIRKLNALRGDTEQAISNGPRSTGIMATSSSLIWKPRTGMKEASLTEPDGTGVLVPLDPRRTPSGNAEFFFKKYKKAKVAHAGYRNPSR